MLQRYILHNYRINMINYKLQSVNRKYKLKNFKNQNRFKTIKNKK